MHQGGYNNGCYAMRLCRTMQSSSMARHANRAMQTNRANEIIHKSHYYLDRPCLCSSRRSSAQTTSSPASSPSLTLPSASPSPRSTCRPTAWQIPPSWTC